MFTEEEYIKLIADIPNSEVAEILFSVLFKIHNKLESNLANMSKKELIQYDMFKLFFKQYNTTLLLSNKVNYIFESQFSYIDLKSIYNLIRSLHELYLTYHYLFSGQHFISIDRNEEHSFKYNLYKLSGLKDSIKSFKYIKKTALYNEQHKEKHDKTVEEIKNLLNEIKATKIYNELSSEVKAEINGGNWKIDKSKKLSWSDMLNNTHIPKEYGVFEYSILSQYAHTSYHSIMLERTHDYNLDGLLCHFYILTSVFVASLSDTFKLNLDDYTLITKRELALIYDFMNLAKNQSYNTDTTKHRSE